MALFPPPHHPFAHFFDGDTSDVPAVNNAVTATGVFTALEAVTSTWPKWGGLTSLYSYNSYDTPFSASVKYYQQKKTERHVDIPIAHKILVHDVLQDVVSAIMREVHPG
ncbi:hypothetical protein AnigIFM62618_008531 [Aspergillus niger]|nr:hypothetical protein AnigIFM62618_008531 [Aspergillus niger]